MFLVNSLEPRILQRPRYVNVGHPGSSSWGMGSTTTRAKSTRHRWSNIINCSCHGLMTSSHERLPDRWASWANGFLLSGLSVTPPASGMTFWKSCPMRSLACHRCLCHGWCVSVSFISIVFEFVFCGWFFFGPFWCKCPRNMDWYSWSLHSLRDRDKKKNVLPGSGMDPDVACQAGQWHCQFSRLGLHCLFPCFQSWSFNCFRFWWTDLWKPQRVQMPGHHVEAPGAAGQASCHAKLVWKIARSFKLMAVAQWQSVSVASVSWNSSCLPELPLHFPLSFHCQRHANHHCYFSFQLRICCAQCKHRTPAMCSILYIVLRHVGVSAARWNIYLEKPCLVYDDLLNTSNTLWKLCKPLGAPI